MKMYRLSVEKLRECGNAGDLIDAITRTREAFADNPPFGVKVGSDEWVNDDYLTSELIHAVKLHWASESDCHPEECPWTGSVIKRMWTSTRKARKKVTSDEVQ